MDDFPKYGAHVQPYAMPNRFPPTVPIYDILGADTKHTQQTRQQRLTCQNAETPSVNHDVARHVILQPGTPLFYDDVWAFYTPEPDSIHPGNYKMP